MTAPSKPCPACQSPLSVASFGDGHWWKDESGQHHDTARCLAVVIGQRDEALRQLANCLDAMATAGMTSMAARAALERLRGGHGH